MRLALLLLLLAFQAFGDIIQSTNRIDWIKGHTVGVRGGIPNDSGWATVNVPVTNTTGLAAAVSAAASGPTIFQLEAGVYDITSGWAITRSYSRFRGVGSNTVLWGSLTVGQEATGDTSVFSITNGGSKGSSNLVLNAIQGTFGDNMVAGDSIQIRYTPNKTNEVFPVVSTTGYDPILFQVANVHSMNGNTVTVTTPLVFDFTNGTVKFLVDPQGATNAYQAFKVGFEHLKITTNNAGTPGPDGLVYMTKFNSVVDCWITNCWLQVGPNYLAGFDRASHVEVVGNWFGPSLGAGTSHAGLITALVGSSLFENNIIAGIPQLGLMFNDGVSGNAFAYNFFTNNSGNGDILMHNTHPVMNLWEGNVIPVKFSMDGYFGSSSHQTLFRNFHPGALAFKRWCSFMQVVGNVIGDTNYNLFYLQPTNGFTQYPVFDFGFPNIGNNNYEDLAPPVSKLWPGNRFKDFAGFYTTNGYTVITQATALTNIIYGNFTNFYEANMSNMPLKFQDPANTNVYWPQDELGVFPASAGSATSMTLNRTLWVTNGHIVYRCGPVAFQWYQPSNILTHTLHGNLLTTNLTPALVWDQDIADHNIPDSLLYNSAPGYHGTNRWPPIDPEAAQPVAVISAWNRYLGIDNGTGGGGETPSSVTNAAPRLRGIRLR